MKKLLIILLVTLNTSAGADNLDYELPTPVVYSQDLLEEFLRPITTQRTWTPQERECLAHNIWHEARGEPLEGQVAVAQVTVNRADHRDFPTNICDVVYQRTRVQRIVQQVTTTIKQVQTWTVCQFSWTCQRVKQPSKTDPQWLATLELVDQFISGDFFYWQSKYRHALNYHAYYVNPGWQLKFFTRTGAHLFYTRH